VTSSQAAQKRQKGTRGAEVLNSALTAIRQTMRGALVRRKPCERISGPFQRLIETRRSNMDGWPPTASGDVAQRSTDSNRARLHFAVAAQNPPAEVERDWLDASSVLGHERDSCRELQLQTDRQEEEGKAHLAYHSGLGTNILLYRSLMTWPTPGCQTLAVLLLPSRIGPSIPPASSSESAREQAASQVTRVGYF